MIQGQRRNHVVIIAISSLFVFGLLFSLRYQGLPNWDTRDYAQIGRNIYAGSGFETSVVYPLSYSHVESVSNHPNILRPPFFPFLVAISFSLFGVNEFAVVAVSGVFYVLISVFIYLFATDLFDEEAGLWAAGIGITSFTMLQHAFSGMTETTFAFIILLMIYAMYKRANIYLVGVLFAIGYLTRYNIVLIGPGILLMVHLFYDDTLQSVLKLGGSAFAVAFPWFVRNVHFVGDPFFSLQRYEIAMHNKVNPGSVLYRTFDPVNPFQFILNNPEVMIRKIANGAMLIYTGMPNILANFVILLLAVVGVVKYVDRDTHLLVGIAAMFASQFATIVFFNPKVRFFVLFAPFIIIFAGGGVSYLLKSKVPRIDFRAFASVFVTVLLVANVCLLAVGFVPSPPPYEHDSDLQYIENEVAEDEFVVTDVPTVVAWESERDSVWVPTTYAALERELPDARYVYLSGRNQQGSAYTTNESFQRDYRINEEFGSGAVLYERNRTG